MHISDWSSDVCSSDLRDPPVTQVKHTFTRIRAEGTASVQDRAIAEEVPIAIEMGGLGYAVLMATPADLDDLAYGFTWSTEESRVGKECVSKGRTWGSP